MGVLQNWIPVNLSLSGTGTATVEGLAGVAGKVRKIVAGTAVIPTEGAVVISNGSTALTSATLSLHSLVAGTAAEQTLATTNKTLVLASTDVLKAAYTITTAGSFVACGLIVWVEPDTW